MVDVHQTVAKQPGVPFRGCSTLYWCLFQNALLPFNPSLLSFLKFHLNSCLPPPTPLWLLSLPPVSRESRDETIAYIERNWVLVSKGGHLLQNKKLKTMPVILLFFESLISFHFVFCCLFVKLGPSGHWKDFDFLLTRSELRPEAEEI